MRRLPSFPLLIMIILLGADCVYIVVAYVVMSWRWAHGIP